MHLQGEVFPRLPIESYTHLLALSGLRSLSFDGRLSEEDSFFDVLVQMHHLTQLRIYVVGHGIVDVLNCILTLKSYSPFSLIMSQNQPLKSKPFPQLLVY